MEATQIQNAIPRVSSNEFKTDPLFKVAQELEASFLTEMLTSAGLGEARKSFGGGVGEDQFSSFLIREQAKTMVNAGGIGLAESIYESLIERSS